MKGTIFALAGALMLAGCGGGGKTASMTPTPAPTPTVLSALPEGHSLESGTIPVGRSQTIYESGGVRVVATCTGADCAIEVSDSGVATVTGGRVTISVTGPTLTTETPTPGTPTTETPTPGTPTTGTPTPGTPTPGTPTPGIPPPGIPPPVPVVGDFALEEWESLFAELPERYLPFPYLPRRVTLPHPEGAVLPPSDGDMVLWEDSSGWRLLWLDRPWADNTYFGYEFRTEPLSFTGTYEGQAFLHYIGTDFLYPGTASLQYDGSDIDLTIDIPGEFNRTWESMTVTAVDPHNIDYTKSLGLYRGMRPPERTQGGELTYGHSFHKVDWREVTLTDGVGDYQASEFVGAAWGFTSGSTAGGGFRTPTGTTGEGIPWGYQGHGIGAWAVSYSDSSDPAP